MLRVILAAIGVLFVITSLVNPAHASGPVDDAIESFHHSKVYVQQGTDGVTNDTVAYLNGFLTKDDHIVIAMLHDTSLNADEAAHKILGSLDEPSILGLFIDGEFRAYSDRLPDDVVSKLMDDAVAISMNPSETLATFVRLVHRYQAEHPEPKPETSAEEQEGGLVGRIVLVGLLAAVLLTVLFVLKRRSASGVDANSTGNDRFDELASKLETDIVRINDTKHKKDMLEMLELLRAVVSKTTKTNPGIARTTADGLRDQLNVMRTIVGGYLDNQEYPELKGAGERMQGYGHAFENFRVFAESRMNDLQAKKYTSLTFEINRWKPQEDTSLSNPLDLS